jgi:UDP-N-acetylmuramoyl-tripeptide--D-alanyl-D-alanine ligase
MMSLQQATDILKGSMSGESVDFLSVSTDTRNLQPGDLYIALDGQQFDGHDYLAQAEVAGAVAAIVHKQVQTKLPHINVADTRKALGELAAAWRQSFAGKVFAITGSNGKTTVKEMLAAILAKQGEVLATKGNFNNDIGLPLTLLRMANEQFAVIEMGANHAGEIACLTNITKPDVALITNAGPAHLEGFGSIKGVAEAKGEIYQGLAEDGVAVVNLDDAYADYWVSLNGRRKIISFSMKNQSADICGTWKPLASGGQLIVRRAAGELTINLRLHGLHNAMNALAAIAAADALGVAGDKITVALNQFESVKGRLNFHQVNEKLLVIDDTYNANPASVNAAIKVLCELPGEHWLVLGDMGELGDGGSRLHFDVGINARAAGVDRLLAIGNASRSAVEAFAEGAMFFDTKTELLKSIQQHATGKLNVLVKGSRFMRMEEIVEMLIKESN